MSWLQRLQNAKNTTNLKSLEPPAQSANDATANTTAPALEDPPVSPESWCWPRGPGMNAVEIDTFHRRAERFAAHGMAFNDAQALADRLVTRDRERDDRRHCQECTRLTGTRCGKRFAVLEVLWRCDGFAGHAVPRHLALAPV